MPSYPYLSAGEIAQEGLDLLELASDADWPTSAARMRFINQGLVLAQRLTRYYKQRDKLWVSTTQTSIPLTARQIELVRVLEVHQGNTKHDVVSLDVLRAARLAAGTRTLKLFAQDRCPPTVTDAVITGSGLNDLTSGGDFTGDAVVDYRVEIDAEGTPDTYKWSNDGGATWEAETQSCTTSEVALENGVTIRFAATTGHTTGDKWDFQGRPYGTLSIEFYPVFTAIAQLELVYESAPPVVTSLDDIVYMPQDLMITHFAWHAAMYRQRQMRNHLGAHFYDLCDSVKRSLGYSIRREPDVIPGHEAG